MIFSNLFWVCLGKQSIFLAFEKNGMVGVPAENNLRGLLMLMRSPLLTPVLPAKHQHFADIVTAKT